MSEQYCAYCRKWKQADGFKTVRSAGNVRYMCKGCQGVRSLSVEDRVELAKREKSERKKK